jgi:hypothetical protein
MSLLPYLDMPRLSRLLQRTDSTFDSEALDSMRRANRMLREAGTGWPEILLRVIDNAIKAQEQQVKDIDPIKAFEEIVRLLYANGKITKEEAGMLMNSIRLVFRSRDTGFRRKVQKKITNAFHRASVIVDQL